MLSASCQTFSHHISLRCRFCLGPSNTITKMIIPSRGGLFLRSLHSLCRSRGSPAASVTAVAHQRLMWMSPTLTVPGTRYQSHDRGPLAAEDTMRSSSGLTLPNHSWWFTGPNGSQKLSPWEPWSLPTGEPFLQLPLLSAHRKDCVSAT